MKAAARGGYIAFVPRSIARDATSAGRLVVLAELSTAHAGVFALYQDRATADLARQAVAILVEYLRSSR